MKKDIFSSVFADGTFETGCNYWASNAGLEMWHEWDENVIDADFERLERANMKILRIFPLWPDFQPLKLHSECFNKERELRMGEDPLDNTTPEGRAGVDPVMVERFEIVCRLAEKHNLKIIVGLLTGWMSGRMFAPPAFERLNLITDARVVKWQTRFMRYMVRRFKDEKAIVAWEIGNECNCMGEYEHDEFYVWMAQLSMAIRCEDSTRPIVSGMHGTHPDGYATPQEMRDLFDVLVTHPYPLFTPYCNTDPLNEMKSALHATAESLMCADIGAVPCIVEEAGTLGTMMVSDELGADYIRASAFSSWAHNLRSFIWWCACEQSELVHTPYDWCAVERELGLFRLDGTKKPVGEALTQVQNFIDNFEFGRLPERITDAVCVLTRGQECWPVAYGTFILAKQAGIDIRFAYSDDIIPDADVYILPSISGTAAITKLQTEKILRRVADGAVLYMSNDSMMISGFEAVSGNRVETSVRAGYSYDVNIPYSDEKANLQAGANIVITPVSSKVICCDENGVPALTENAYGKGRVYYCNYPIEKITGIKPGVVSGQNAVPLYKFYSALGIRSAKKCATKDNPYLGVTEHIIDENTRVLVLINYDKYTSDNDIMLEDGWKFDKITAPDKLITAEACNGGFRLHILHNNGAVAVLKK